MFPLFPTLHRLLKEGCKAVCLVKPQFEAGKEKVGKKGVVRDGAVHKEVIEKVIAEATAQGFAPLGLDYSPVKGPEGNIEFLLFLQKTTEGECSVTQQDIQTVVSAAHDSLGGNV